jgi:Arc/MetJ-type ribon-helix-helix transcriptional regulator
MGTKRRAVVNADEAQIEAVETLIEQGAYRTLSEFVREAIAEKLERIRQGRLAEEVERYCRAEGIERDDDLVAAQAFDESPPKRKPARGRRAKG